MDKFNEKQIKPLNESSLRTKLKNLKFRLQSSSKLRRIQNWLKLKRHFQYIRFSLYVCILFFVGFILYSQNFTVSSIDSFFRNLDFDYYLAFIALLLAISFLLDLLAWLAKVEKLKRFTFLQSIKFKYAGEFFLLSLVIISVVLFLSYYKKHPQYSYTYPKTDEALIDYSKPLEVKFNVPVRVDKVKPSITPAISGEWIWEPYLGIDSLTRVGKFYITETPFPNQRFVAYVAGINKITDKKEHEYGFIFHSPEIPSIEDSYPINGAIDVLKNSNILVTYSAEYQDLVDIDVKIEPKVDFNVLKLSEKELNIVMVRPLSQGVEYKVTFTYKPKSINLENNETITISDERIVQELKFTTTKEPSIKSSSPTGNSVKASEPITVTFIEPMDRESVETNFSVVPKVEGEFEWLDDQTFTYKIPTELSKDTEYKVTILKGTQSKAGGSLENNIEYSFKTLGKVWVTGFTPENGISSVNEFTEIFVNFDQEVDHGVAESKFSISPGVAGGFRWDGNTMVFKPSSALSLETLYTVNVAGGVKSLYGIDSEAAFTSQFRTRTNAYSFNIPIYYQPAGFTCNIYTAIMILAWKGIGAEATSLIAEIGYNDSQSNGNWTGNPYKEYIGNSVGTYGYGVYWPPIKNILAARGVSTEVRENWNITELTNTVQQGHPVIVWRYNGVGGGQNISWTASDGTYVNAFNGMHGSIVTGFTGPADNPTSIYIHDPWLGRLWIDRATFDAYWSYSGRTALIVY